MKLKSALIAFLKYALIAAALYFVFIKVRKNWADFVSYEWEINWLWLCVSIILQILPLFIFSSIWRKLIAAFGHYNVTHAAAFKISYLANLGRYIPGRIWQVFGMIYLARKVKIQEGEAVASWALTQMFAIPAAFLVAALCVWLHPEMLDVVITQNLQGPLYAAIILLALTCVLIVAAPAKMLKAYNWFLKLVRRQPVRMHLSPSTAAQIFFGYALGWAIFGLAFWLFLFSITGKSDLPVSVGVGVFTLAYQIGYLAFFTPGGLGVRELVMTTTLIPFLGPIAAGISVAARLWNILAELLSSAIALSVPLKSDS